MLTGKERIEQIKKDIIGKVCAIVETETAELSKKGVDIVSLVELSKRIKAKNFTAGVSAILHEERKRIMDDIDILNKEEQCAEIEEIAQDACSSIAFECRKARALLDAFAAEHLAKSHVYGTVLEKMSPVARKSVIFAFWKVADERKLSGFAIVIERFLSLLDMAAEGAGL